MQCLQVKEPEEFTKKQADKEARKAKRQKRAGNAASTITSFLTGTSELLEDDGEAAAPLSDPALCQQGSGAGD